VAAAIAAEGRSTTLVASGDRDAFQLASETATILYPLRGGEIARLAQQRSERSQAHLAMGLLGASDGKVAKEALPDTVANRVLDTVAPSAMHRPIRSTSSASQRPFTRLTARPTIMAGGRPSWPASSRRCRARIMLARLSRKGQPKKELAGSVATGPGRCRITRLASVIMRGLQYAAGNCRWVAPLEQRSGPAARAQGKCAPGYLSASSPRLRRGRSY
jgi:hypothetical protein